MNTLFLVSAGIIVLYAVNTVVLPLIHRRLCALCASVSLTWLGLLIAYRFGRFDDALIIGILMGETVVGLMHLLEEHLPERFRLFRLPYLLTATAIAYALLTRTNDAALFIMLAALWIITSAFYFARHSPRAGALIRKIIACCRDW